MSTTIHIDEDLGVDWADAGQWRSYQLVAEGNTYKELLDSAGIEEVDQDGGSLNFYGIEDSPADHYDLAIKIIQRHIQARRGN